MIQKFLFVEQRPGSEGKVGNAVESRRLNSHSQRFLTAKARADSLAAARRETLRVRGLALRPWHRRDLPDPPLSSFTRSAIPLRSSDLNDGSIENVSASSRRPVSEELSRFETSLTTSDPQVRYQAIATPSSSKSESEDACHQEDQVRIPTGPGEATHRTLPFLFNGPSLDGSSQPHANCFELGDGFLDPFSTSSIPITPRMRQLLYYYFRDVVPLAQSLIFQWNWIRLLPKIQESPCLLYAVCAYSAAFFAGVQFGSPALVLPPPIKAQETRPLWPIPEWFVYANKSISLVKERVNSWQAGRNDAIFHSILLLFRLQVSQVLSAARHVGAAEGYLI